MIVRTCPLSVCCWAICMLPQDEKTEQCIVGNWPSSGTITAVPLPTKLAEDCPRSDGRHSQKDRQIAEGGLTLPDLSLTTPTSTSNLGASTRQIPAQPGPTF